LPIEISQSVLVYHDETEFTAGKIYKGHVLFIVPADVKITLKTPLFGDWSDHYHPWNNLVAELTSFRKNTRVNRKFHFTDISGRKWVTSDTVARAFVSTAVDALRHKRSLIFRRPLSCKLAIQFFSEQTDLSLYGGETTIEKRLRHHETVLRMLLKGALHYLYGEGNEVRVERIISDGHPFHRDLDDSRILWQITVDHISGRQPLRSYVKFKEDARVEQYPSDHKNYSYGSKKWNHSNILQVTDLLLGSTIRACHIGCPDYPKVPRTGARVTDKKGIIAYPVKDMMSKYERGYGFRHSGHYKSFSVSYVDFHDDEVSFTNLHPKDFEVSDDNLKLPFDMAR
jgi:hypothetical protein